MCLNLSAVLQPIGWALLKDCCKVLCLVWGHASHTLFFRLPGEGKWLLVYQRMTKNTKLLVQDLGDPGVEIQSESPAHRYSVRDTPRFRWVMWSDLCHRRGSARRTGEQGSVCLQSCFVVFDKMHRMRFLEWWSGPGSLKHWTFRTSSSEQEPGGFFCPNKRWNEMNVELWQVQVNIFYTSNNFNII